MSATKQPPVALIVLDGWGIRAEKANNAIAMARTPVFDELLWQDQSMFSFDCGGPWLEWDESHQFLLLGSPFR